MEKLKRPFLTRSLKMLPNKQSPKRNRVEKPMGKGQPVEKLKRPFQARSLKFLPNKQSLKRMSYQNEFNWIAICYKST